MFTGIVEEVGRVAAIERHAAHARLVVACERVTADARVGDSISVSGCCLTITELLPGGDTGGRTGGWEAAADPEAAGADDAGGRTGGWEAAADPEAAVPGAGGPAPAAGGKRSPDAAAPGGFVADLMAETMTATSLGDLTEGASVNLERALRADDRLGGHLVQGHVDGVGEVVDRREQPGTVWLSIAAPGGLGRYLVPKGSVTVDGASLTVVDVRRQADDVVFDVALIPHTLEVTTFGDRDVGDRVNLEADVVAKYVERLLAAGTDTPYDALGDGAPAPGSAASVERPQEP